MLKPLKFPFIGRYYNKTILSGSIIKPEIKDPMGILSHEMFFPIVPRYNLSFDGYIIRINAPMKLTLYRTSVKYLREAIKLIGVTETEILIFSIRSMNMEVSVMRLDMCSYDGSHCRVMMDLEDSSNENN